VEPSSCGLSVDLEVEDEDCDFSLCFERDSKVGGGSSSIASIGVGLVGKVVGDVGGEESAVMSSIVVWSSALDGGLPPAGHHREGSVVPTGHHRWVVRLMKAPVSLSIFQGKLLEQ
jgi:hypothetical protein